MVVPFRRPLRRQDPKVPRQPPTPPFTPPIASQIKENIDRLQVLMERNPKAAKWLVKYCTNYLDDHLE